MGKLVHVRVSITAGRLTGYICDAQGRIYLNVIKLFSCGLLMCKNISLNSRNRVNHNYNSKAFKGLDKIVCHGAFKLTLCALFAPCFL